MGKKDGRPKKEDTEKPNENPTKTQIKPNRNPIKTQYKSEKNLNVNDNDNVNVNVNDNENKNENDVVLFFVEKYKTTGLVKLEDKMKFLREIKSEEKYKELSEKDEHNLIDYVLKT